MFLCIPVTSIHDLIKNVIQKIRSKLVSKFLPLSGEEAQGIQPKNKFKFFPNALGAIDSTIIDIRRPSNPEMQKRNYSGKHKRHCVKFQCLVNPDGWCIHYCGVFNGRKHDIKVFELSKIPNFFQNKRELRNGQRIFYHPQILADSGYQGAQKNYEEIVIPIKKPKGGQLNENEKEHNRKLGHDRVIVENFFGRMKSLFGITFNEYRGDIELLKEIIPIVICLTNYHIKEHPLRNPNQDPISENPSSDNFSDFHDYSDDNCQILRSFNMEFN